MAVFDKDIIKIEGELSNDKNDKGGLTKYGISQRSYPHLDIVNLTLEQALNIYENDYWDKNNLNHITSQLVANQLFLLIINTGAETAIKIIQKAVTRRGMKLKIDGVIGNITLQAINMCNPFSLSESMRVAECEYYLAITDRDKTQIKFFRGWIRRALM